MKVMYEGHGIEIDDVIEGEQSLDYYIKSRIPTEKEDIESTREISENKFELEKDNLNNDSK